MMGRGDISPWLPEPDLATHQCITKMGEESAELSKICFRILAQGLAGSDPTTKQSNVDCLVDELSDNCATQEFCQRIIGLTAKADRVMRKVNGYEHWFKLIGIDMGNGEEAIQAEPAVAPEPVGNFPIVYTQKVFLEHQQAIAACIEAGYSTTDIASVVRCLSERCAALELEKAVWGG